MESTFLSMSIFSLSKSVNNHSTTPLIAHLHRRFSTTRPSQLTHCIDLSRFVHSSFVRARGPFDLRRNRLQFVANYAASSTSGGGGFGGTYGNSGGGGGGGDGAAEGGDIKPRAVTAGIAEAPSLGSDVIILDVSGMTCGGCAASVKRILESQPQVSSASVNLTTETAIVWPMAEAKVAPNWQKDIGEALAKHLTSCGFKSNLRDQGAVDEDIQL